MGMTSLIKSRRVQCMYRFAPKKTLRRYGVTRYTFGHSATRPLFICSSTLDRVPSLVERLFLWFPDLFFKTRESVRQKFCVTMPCTTVCKCVGLCATREATRAWLLLPHNKGTLRPAHACMCASSSWRKAQIKVAPSSHLRWGGGCCFVSTRKEELVYVSAARMRSYWPALFCPFAFREAVVFCVLVGAVCISIAQ